MTQRPMARIVIEHGDIVRTLSDRGHKDFMPGMRSCVRWGVEGTVIDSSDAHGQIYHVRHDATSAWYDEDEVELVDPSLQLKEMLTAIGIPRMRSIEAARLAFPFGTVVCFVAPDDYENIEVKDEIVGDPYIVVTARHVDIKIPTREHGGILMQDLRVDFHTVLHLRALAYKERH